MMRPVAQTKVATLKSQLKEIASHELQRRNMPELVELTLFNKFINIEKPIFNQEMKKRITQDMNLEEKIIQNYNLRISNHNMFLPYKQAELKMSLDQEKSKQTAQRQSIFMNRDQIQQKDFYKFIEDVNGLQNRIYDKIYDPSSIYIMMKEQQFFSYNNIKRTKALKTDLGDLLKIKLEAERSTNSQIDKKLQKSEMSFDDILKIKEESFWLLDSKPLNIFAEVLNDCQNILSKDELNKFCFSFTSMDQKMKTYKTPIYRDISQISRKLAYGSYVENNKRNEIIEGKENAFTLQSLDSYNMLSIASGRFISDALLMTLEGVDKHKFQDSSAISDSSEGEYDKGIYYPENTQNSAFKYAYKDEQKQQRAEYLKLPLEQRDTEFNQRCREVMQAFKMIMVEEERLNQRHIEDPQLRGKLTAKKDEIFSKQIDNLNRKKSDVDRLISENKLGKNKQQSLQMNSLLQINRLRKNLQNRFNRMSRNKNDATPKKKQKKGNLKL